MFLPAATKLGQGNIFTSVCLSTGGSASVHAGMHPLEQTPPGVDNPPEQTPPLGADTPREQTPPPEGRLQHTVYERLVRILLECILVTPVCHSVHR